MEAIELAAAAGLFLDDWQQFVLTHSLGERRDGKWSAPTVGLVVGRQNGKNSILEARELAGLFLLGEKVIVHSAHEQATSSEHFRRLLERIESVPEFERRVLKAPKGKGAEAIELRGGQRVLFKTRTGGGGRGFTVDLLVYDEAMILSAAAKAALVPTLAANSMEGNTQTWYSGSAVDQQNPKHDGAELSRIRAKGIAGEAGVAYFEWSAEGDDPSNVPAEAAADPAVVALANPGLGIRISHEWVEHERTVELGAREFAVERLGVGDWPDPDGAETVFDMDQWRLLADAGSEMRDPVCFALDANPERTWASIGAAGPRGDGLWHVEMVERHKGTGWCADRVVSLVERHRPLGVVVASSSPAASLVHLLEERGVKVTVASATQYTDACGLIFDAVDQAKMRHLGQGELTTAARAAAQRLSGDSWAWSRRSSASDISPLVACTLAHWGSVTNLGTHRKGPPRVIDLSTI